MAAALTRAALLLLVLAGTGAAAESVQRVRPLAPDDGARVGPQPVFRVAYETTAEVPPRDLRFRLDLSPLDDGGATYRFDGGQRRRDWLPGGPGEVLYRPRKPLADGRYRWRPAAWDGVAWVESADSRTVTIDAVPPAEVTALSVTRRADGGVALRWDPVVLDAAGAPEFVARYHVYRYERRGPFRNVRVHEIAAVETPGFVDRHPLAEGTEVLFYKVAAEDAAGNEPGRRR